MSAPRRHLTSQPPEAVGERGETGLERQVVRAFDAVMNMRAAASGVEPVAFCPRLLLGFEAQDLAVPIDRVGALAKDALGAPVTSDRVEIRCAVHLYPPEL